MDVIDVINKINYSYEEVYKKIKPAFLYSDSYLTFTNGYCYEFFLLLKRFYYNAELMIQNDKMHCAVLINDKLYDTNGIRSDLYNFHFATGVDYEYIYKYYGFFDNYFKEELNKAVVKNVLSKNNGYSKTLKKPSYM